MNEQKNSPLSRRAVIKGSLATGAFWATQGLLSSDVAAAGQPVVEKIKNATILFQGDSITDAGRNRRNKGPNNAGAFGRGYPFLLASYLLAKYPKEQLKIFNRGISGNKVPDLDKRWQADCIDIKPDVLSILIGVNDIWHKLNGRYKGTVESYEEGFNALLSRTKEALPKTKLVICEPFVLRCGAINDKWFPEFTQRKEAAKRVAQKAGAIWVPFQEAFDEGVKSAPPKYWAGDGVHPSMAGHALMAKTWIEAVKV